MGLGLTAFQLQENKFMIFGVYFKNILVGTGNQTQDFAAASRYCITELSPWLQFMVFEPLRLWLFIMAVLKNYPSTIYMDLKSLPRDCVMYFP